MSPINQAVALLTAARLVGEIYDAHRQRQRKSRKKGRDHEQRIQTLEETVARMRSGRP